jgi:N-acetylmuramoyl-L-alanine amidase
MSIRMRVMAGLIWVLSAGMAVAQSVPPPIVPDGSALARMTGPGALVTTAGAGLALELPLSMPVPWRARLWADPPRAVLDFRRVDFAGLRLIPAGAAVAARTGEAGGGWSRLVIELDRPMTFATLGLATEPATGAARLSARLVPATAAEFDRQRRAMDPDGSVPAGGAVLSAQPAGRSAASEPLRVILDPGHGGVDPGAVHGGLTEAGLVLAFSRELAEALRRAGGFEVTLTRDEDVFVSLEARVRRAREARAQVFLSLHADSLEDGEAQGVTLYTLAAEASDVASAQLAERHDRANLLGGGADMTGVEDEVALVLMDLTRTETRPGTERLVEALIGAIQGEGLPMHPRPWQQAAFSVLRAPDIPSVLIELGFMSSPRDRARLVDPAWRARMVMALVTALERWRDEEAGRRPLRGR